MHMFTGHCLHATGFNMTHKLITCTTDELENDPMSGAEKLKGRYGDILNGSDFKMKDIVNTYVGEMVTSIQKTALVTGGTESHVCAFVERVLAFLNSRVETLLSNRI